MYCPETFSKLANKLQGLYQNPLVFKKSANNIVVWKLQLQIITYFEQPEKLETIAHFYLIFTQSLVCSIFLIIFLINQLFNFVPDPQWIPVTTENCFVWNKVRADMFNCFNKYIDLFVNIFFCQGSFTRIITDCSLNKISNCILIMSNFAFVGRWIMNFQIKFNVYYLIMVLLIQRQMDS